MPTNRISNTSVNLCRINIHKYSNICANKNALWSRLWIWDSTCGQVADFFCAAPPPSVDRSQTKFLIVSSRLVCIVGAADDTCANVWNRLPMESNNKHYSAINWIRNARAGVCAQSILVSSNWALFPKLWGVMLWFRNKKWKLIKKMCFTIIIEKKIVVICNRAMPSYFLFRHL